jgi:hypothetical protein
MEDEDDMKLAWCFPRVPATTTARLRPTCWAASWSASTSSVAARLTVLIEAPDEEETKRDKLRHEERGVIQARRWVDQHETR